MIQSRASKGSVTVEEFRGRLRLHLPRFLYEGKNKYLSLGLDDTPENRKLAEAKARSIESDIIYERFDPTLNKYRPQHLQVVSSEEKPKTVPKLDELWTKFLDFKRPQCSPSTMAKSYKQFSSYLERMPHKSLDEAGLARDWIVANLPNESGKRFIVRLNACCDWAKEAGLIHSNPFIGMAKTIKKPKGEKGDDELDINPFTAEERDRIIEAFRTNSACPKYSRIKHSYYYSYILFLFNTGCRPSEAVALRWKDVEPDYTKILFSRSTVNSTEGRVEKSGLKTQKKRTFPCNGKMREFLQSIKPENCSPESLVFPSPDGKWINSDNFRRRTWKPILEALGIEYRKPYQTRHTFITLALENGLDAKDVAKFVGNSPEIIYKHYAGNKREMFIPEF